MSGFNLSSFLHFSTMAMLWATVLLTACAPAPPYEAAAPATHFAKADQPLPINSPAFERRTPLPGRPGYLQTIKYIDDGMKYIDPSSQFFVSPIGELCFRTWPSTPQLVYYSFYSVWCVYPQSVERVEKGSDAIAKVVRLLCMHGSPQCVHNEIGLITSEVSAATTNHREVRSAVENLIYMMGGNVGFDRPYAFDGAKITPGSRGADRRRRPTQASLRREE